MAEGVAIAFAVIFFFVALIGLVLFKEVRTHRFWRRLVEENDLEAIRGLLEGEIEGWRTMRPPKGISAAVWAGVQGMELLAADASFVHLGSSAQPEFRVVEGKQTQVATALDGALATAVKLVEMVFYDIADYRPEVVRVDVYTAFREEAGVATSRPILSVTADRADAMGIDWDEPDARQIALSFDAVYELGPAGEPRPIVLPPSEPALTVAAGEEMQDASSPSDAGAEDRSSGVS